MQNPGFHLDGKARMHGTFTSGKSVISFCGRSQYIRGLSFRESLQFGESVLPGIIQKDVVFISL